MRIVDGDQIRPAGVTVLEAADGVRKAATAVRKRDAQLRQFFQHAAKDHRADRQCGFRRHANQPGRPVFRHALAAEHFPGVHEDRGAQILCCGEHIEQRRFVEIQSVDIGADLDAGEAEFVYATLQFAHRQFAVLHRHGAQTGKSGRRFGHDAGEVIV